MTPPARCRECGDTKELDALGVCVWRDGCDHRLYQHEAAMGRLNADLAAIGRPIPSLTERLRELADRGTVDPGTLRASGGWCAPVGTMYEPFTVPRGGIPYGTPGPPPPEVPADDPEVGELVHMDGDPWVVTEVHQGRVSLRRARDDEANPYNDDWYS